MVAILAVLRCQLASRWHDTVSSGLLLHHELKFRRACMCGIAGFLNLDSRSADPLLLARMIALQFHRGPDDVGLRLFSLRQGTSMAFARGRASMTESFEGGLAFARLSIVDLSDRGHQPMMSDDGNLIVAFNGEIYNANDYRNELISCGHIFHGTSDTEVLLKLHLQHGLDGMLARIEGMFAIVIIDLRLRTLTIVRDRTGIKPIYWAKVKNSILFGSEIKSFLVHPDFSSEIDEKNLDEYVAFRYCAGDRHLLRGVQALQPGRYITFTLGDAPVERRYYAIPDAREGATKSNGAAALDELESSIKSSVTSQLLADVKVGCQLSGGIDSSLITLFANTADGNPVDAFSIILGDQRLSEERWIDEAASAAGAKSHRFCLESDYFFKNLESATWHLEQPINHPNTIGIKLLAEEAQPHVKVLLSGEGVDELMGGYNRFYHAGMRGRSRFLSGVLARSPIIGERWSRNMRPDISDDTEFFIAASMHMQPAQLAEFRPQCDLTTAFEQRRAVFEEGHGSYLSRCMKYEMQTHMVDLLVRQDRMTMAHSIEGRVPFLSSDLIALVRSLSDDMLVGSEPRLASSRAYMTKVSLKKVARRHFREEFVYRPKSGFTLPLLAYYNDKRFADILRDVILPGIKRRGVFESEPLQRAFGSINEMPRTLDESLWIPIMFELWAQQWVDGKNLANGSEAMDRASSLWTNREVW